MCSNCAGDYEDPDRTASSVRRIPDGPCDHTAPDCLRWDACRGEFECLDCGEYLHIPELEAAIAFPERSDILIEQ